MGYEIGKSILDADNIDFAKELLEKAEAAGVKMLLPVDVVCADDFSNDANTVIVDRDQMPADMEGLDIGPKTVELYKETLLAAKTVVWNGPMGVFEDPRFAKGTIEICKALAELDGATTIIGGGDSASAAKNLGFAEKFSHISTGGGASLEFMEGKELPGISIIPEK
jgi:phosphoglycerate kinase